MLKILTHNYYSLFGTQETLIAIKSSSSGTKAAHIY